MELWSASRCAQFLGYTYDHFRKEIPQRIDPHRERVCGIYFLLKGDEIVYVGQSIDVLGRVKNSARGTHWGITSFGYIQCPIGDLSLIERSMILWLKPPRNVSPSRPGFLCVPSLKKNGSVFVKIQ